MPRKASPATPPSDAPAFTPFDNLDAGLCDEVRATSSGYQIPGREASREIHFHWIATTATVLLKCIPSHRAGIKSWRETLNDKREDLRREGKDIDAFWRDPEAAKYREMLAIEQKAFDALRPLCQLLRHRLRLVAPDLALKYPATRTGISTAIPPDDSALLRDLEGLANEADATACARIAAMATNNDEPASDGLTVSQLATKSHFSEDTIRRYARSAGVPMPASGKRGTLIPWSGIEKIKDAHIAANPNAREQWDDFMKKHRPAMHTPKK